MDRAELTGHTALCLVTLVGFFIYTSSYSVVYHVVRSGSTVKPVAILEMWMVWVHLLSAIITCALYAVCTIRTSDLQTAVFLGVAISASTCGAGCIQDAEQCAVFFPAAAWAPLAAAGAIAWAWIVYLASLGCQSESVSLGTTTSHILAPLVVALFAPSVVAIRQQTCAVGNAPLSLGLHLTLLSFAFVLWNGSQLVVPPPTRVAMRVMAAVLAGLDAVIALQGASAWIVCALLLVALSDGQITSLLFGARGVTASKGPSRRV